MIFLGKFQNSGDNHGKSNDNRFQIPRTKKAELAVKRHIAMMVNCGAFWPEYVVIQTWNMCVLDNM